MKKELEDMSIEELLNQFFEAYKQGSRPKEAKISAEGLSLIHI